MAARVLAPAARRVAGVRAGQRPSPHSVIVFGRLLLARGAAVAAHPQTGEAGAGARHGVHRWLQRLREEGRQPEFLRQVAPATDWGNYSHEESQQGTHQERCAG